MKKRIIQMRKCQPNLVAGLNQTLYGLAAGGMFFAGAMNSVMTGAFFAVLQVMVPADMKGRVFTLLQSGGVMIPQQPFLLGVDDQTVLVNL